MLWLLGNSPLRGSSVLWNGFDINSCSLNNTTKQGKASLAETFFQKLFGKRRAARIEGSGSGFGAGGSIPGVGARFLGVGSISGWILGSGPIIRFWRGFAIFQLFSI